MRLSRNTLREVAQGRVTLAFRRWSSPETFAGARLSTEVGLVEVGEVREVDPAAISEEQARRAGFRSAAGLRSSLDKHGRGRVYRIGLSLVEASSEVGNPDPVELGARERDELDRQLSRMDVGSWRGRWTRALLELVWQSPGVPAAELAATRGRGVSRLKSDVFALSELGLVQRWAGGYRLTSRGVGYLQGDASGSDR